MTFLEFSIYVLSVYAGTLLLTTSKIFVGVRYRFRQMLSFLPLKFFVLRNLRGDPVLIDEEDYEEEFHERLTGYDFISCRMCVGVWVTVAFCAFTTPFFYWLAIYGAAYFLATQERD